MIYRAICTDIDGTMLDSRRELSPFTIETFRKLPPTVPVILASSRMPSAMTHLQAEMGILHHPLISYNGGYVIHNREHAGVPMVLESVYIPVRICEAIVNMVAQTPVHLSLYAEDNWYARQHDQWTERESRITKVSPIIRPFGEVIGHWHAASKGAHKLMCMGDEADITRLHDALVERFGNDIHVYYSKSTYLELAPKSISKSTGLALVLRTVFGLTMGDAVAFGDNYNDMDMLRDAGMGVAVGNARPEVKAIAKRVAGNSKEDGVAHVVAEYFLATPAGK